MIEMTTEDWKSLAIWAITGDTGLSSTFMARYIAGVAENPLADIGTLLRGVGRIDWPHDSDDFGRCWRLVKAVPKLREGFSQIREVHPIWRELVDRFDELGALLEEAWKTGQWGPWSRSTEASTIIRQMERDYYESVKPEMRPIEIPSEGSIRITVQGGNV